MSIDPHLVRNAERSAGSAAALDRPGLTRRQVAVALAGLLAISPARVIATSIEPILRDAKFIVIDTLVPSAPGVPASRVADILSARASEILASELAEYGVQIPVVSSRSSLQGDVREDSVLYVRLRIDLSLDKLDNTEAIIGAVRTRFQRVRFSEVHSAAPVSLFMANENSVVEKALAALREQLRIAVATVLATQAAN